MGLLITWDEFGCRSDVVQMSFQMSFRSRLVFRNLQYCSVTDLGLQRQAAIQTTSLMFKSYPKSAVPSQPRKITLKKTLDSCTIGM